MKRCPSCGNTYTNDGLVFCLEDGSTLLSVSNSQSSFDSEATLQISAEEPPPPTVRAQDPRAASTLITPQPALTSPPRAAPHTSDNQAPTAPASTSNPLFIIGITTIVVLLLVIAGIGIALLVRSSSSDKANPTENKDGVVSSNQNRNPSNTVASQGDAASREKANSANRNSAANDAPSRAEAKVVRGAALVESDLAALSHEELRRLRNAVYARHGRTFDSPDLQHYFDSRPWYRPRSDYSEAELTETDHANIKLIQTVER